MAEELKDIANLVYREAEDKGAKDISVITTLSLENMVRFSNNSISVVKNNKNLEVFTYISKDKKRFLGSTSDLTNLKDFVDKLYKACITSRESEDYTPLEKPKRPFREHGNFDEKIAKGYLDLVDLTNLAINSALKEGAERVAGSLLSSTEYFYIKTSSGVEREDRSTRISLNVRAFIEKEISGHGLSCSSNSKDFDVEKAGREAGEDAKKSKNRGKIEEGKYEILYKPTVAADLLQHIGYFSSAYSVEIGISFFINKLNEKVAIDSLYMIDSALNGINCRSFDDEGYSTGDTLIIEGGILRNYLHNLTTAKKFKTESTGNAGIIEPSPWNLIINEGRSKWEDIIKDIRKGLLITNNWYTRFQNLRNGEFSTLPRDATYFVEGGEIKYSVAGLRISDSLPRMLMNIEDISKERRWIKWWEVEIPVLSPWLKVKDVLVTKAE